MGRYGGNGFGPKRLGLGVGAGFIGGAALGIGGSMAVMGVYHRYQQYQYMNSMMMGGHYRNPYYSQNQCYGGCPPGAHCEWGFCECNRGLEKRFGRCERNWGQEGGRAADFNPFQTCHEGRKDCQKLDMNLICNFNKTMGPDGRCECREDMRWNEKASECQLFLDVDCSAITYDTPASTTVLKAVNSTLEKIGDKNVTLPDIPETVPESEVNSTKPIAMGKEEALANSLLSSLDVNNTSEAELKEAYCRDIDSFSWEFGGQQAKQNQNQNQNQNHGGTNWNRNRNVAGGVGGGVIVVIVLSSICCLCGIVYAFKRNKRNKHMGDDTEPPVTFSNTNTVDAGLGPPVNGGMGLYGNPGYQPQPTPQHVVSATGVIYPGPAAIPPTQPGYTNYPGQGNQPTFPTQPTAYPPQPATVNLPYPVQPTYPVLPPVSPAGYPPVVQGGTPYPPTNPAMPLPYPTQNQPAYNPNAP